MGAKYVLQYDNWAYFFSQIDASGSGCNNCGPASICCCAMAAGTVDRSRSWQSLIDEAAWNCRHEPNTPYNDYVSFAELERAMSAWNLSYELTYDFATAQASPWSIVLCAGAVLKLADGSDFYPDSWFNYSTSPDHFIAWLPQYNGAANWCCNPLYPADTLAQMSIDSLRAGFGGAYILYDMPTVEPPVQVPEQLAPARFRAIRPEGFHLKPSPASGGPNVPHGFVALGEEGNDTGRRVVDAQDASKKWGLLQYARGGDPALWAEGWTISNAKYFERLP